MDRMTDDERADILDEAYDNLERAREAELETRALDPDRPDALEAWNRTRPKPEPPARQPITAIQERAARDQQWNNWVDDRIQAAWKNIFADAIGQNTARERRLMRDHVAKELRREIALLRDELAAARREIKALGGEPHQQIIGWKIDREKYRAVPFFSNGRPGLPINLRPLFETYHVEVNS
jgi:hypothetical protein